MSLSSLAYAKRKIDELSLNNIDIIHADILDLKNLNKKFDVIESVGTIHHMKDPIEGLKILLQILKPHGYLKIGLYSELARDYVVKSRELIKKKQFNNNIEDIRECRKLIFNEKDNSIIQNITKRADFYSTSNVRDLIFHVQEHSFTIPEISKIIKNLDLEFLGFNNSLIIKVSRSLLGIFSESNCNFITADPIDLINFRSSIFLFGTLKIVSCP